MSSQETIGELSQKDNGITVEWRIKDIFSYTKEDEDFHSPFFSVPGSHWHLEIYPNGDTSDDTSSGWICIYLFNDSAHPKKADYTLGVKNVNGTIEKKDDGSSMVFKKDGQCGFGTSEFLERSEFLRRKSELAPSGDLTITCTLSVHDSHDCSSALNTLSEDLKELFSSRRGCDATLKVLEEEFHVHRSVLTARSSVLATMFEVDMKEKTTGVVDIVDCQPEAFKEFLAYLYAGEFDGHSKQVSELYRIAHKYDVEELKSGCVQNMLSTLSAENFCEAAIIGHQFDETELTRKTQEFFDKEFRKIISLDNWDSFLKNNFTLANGLLKNMATLQTK